MPRVRGVRERIDNAYKRTMTDTFINIERLDSNTTLVCGTCWARVPASRLVTVQAMNQYCCQRCLEKALFALNEHRRLVRARARARVGESASPLPFASLMSLRDRRPRHRRFFAAWLDGTKHFFRTLRKWATTDLTSSGE